MPYTLLGGHVNATTGGLPEMVARWKPPVMVILDHADVWLQAKLHSPQTVFVGRIFVERQPDFGTDLDPIRTANDHCAWLLKKFEQIGSARLRQTYSFWQGVNEPIIKSADAMKRYAAFEAERARIMSVNGFKVVVGSFSVGNPELAYWREFLPALEAAREFAGALALHEYAWPRMDGDPEWLLLRHRKVYDGEPAHGWPGLPDHLKSLPLIITECGLDGLIQLSSPHGWRDLYTPSHYLAQLEWYDRELHKDPYVVGAAVYCCSYEHVKWQPYDIWPEVARTLAEQATPVYRLNGEAPPEPGPHEEPTPEPPPEPPVGTWQMTVRAQPGAKIIAGSLPRAGIEVRVVDPWGNAAQVVSGSKPEYGPGGFEVLAPNAVEYSITFLDQTFKVVSQGNATIVEFSETSRGFGGPARGDGMEALLAKLDEIIALLEQRI